MPALPPRLFARGSWPEAGRLADVLRAETVGGALLAATWRASLLTTANGMPSTTARTSLAYVLSAG